MGPTRFTLQPIRGILVAVLTVLVAGLLWDSAVALNTFMVMVDPKSVDCYFVQLKTGQSMKLSMIVEHDSKDIAVHNKVDLSLYNPANKFIKSFNDLEHIETQYVAETDGFHLYCYSNKHDVLRAPVSFSIMSPEEESAYSKNLEDILKTDDGKDFKVEALSDIVRLENSMKYLMFRVQFLERRTIAHSTRLKRIQRITMYWKLVQILAVASFAVFQIFCTKRFINTRGLA